MRWRRMRRAAGKGTRALLRQLAVGDPEDIVEAGDLMMGLGRRAFGVLLLLAIPTSFIPGVAGIVSTPIVSRWTAASPGPTSISACRLKPASRMRSASSERGQRMICSSGHVAR